MWIISLFNYLFNNTYYIKRICTPRVEYYNFCTWFSSSSHMGEISTLLLPITFSFFISCTLVSSIIISILRPREKYWDTLNEFRAYHWLLAIAQRPNIPYFSMLALTCAGQTFYDCAQTGVSSRRRAVTVKKPSSFSRGMEYSHILT